MNEHNFWWFLLCIIEDHNRLILSGGDPAAIVHASPCCAIYGHDPADVWHWVIVVETPAPITLLGSYLQSVPRCLAQHFSVEGVPVAVNPFEV